MGLVLSLSPAIATPQQTEPQVTGYDAGLCGPDQFVAVHVAISDKEITVQFVNPGPNKVFKLDRPQVFKFTKEDADGRHYLYEEKQFELVVKFDKSGVDGILYVDGAKAAKFYGAKAADEKNLAEAGFMFFQMCQQIHESADASKS